MAKLSTKLFEKATEAPAVSEVPSKEDFSVIANVLERVIEKSKTGMFSIAPYEWDDVVAFVVKYK